MIHIKSLNYRLSENGITWKMPSWGKVLLTSSETSWSVSMLSLALCALVLQRGNQYSG